MATRRVLIAARFCSAAAVFQVSVVYADAPSPPDAPAPDPQTGDAPNDPSGVQAEPVMTSSDVYADTDPSALTDFRAALDPHGTWVHDPVYGTVWVPSPDEVGADFAPYVTAGHWAYDSDYVWMSDYEWGWVPFHYGRWEQSREIGWLWIPGRAYSGAWVSWRVGSDGFAYVGWSPMSATWAWRDGVAVATLFAPWQRFFFCQQGDLFAPVIAPRIATGESAAAIAPHTRPYVPAHPAVDGTAQPSVGATAKSAGPRRLTATGAHGPPPALLGIDPARVVHRTGADQGMANALAYAHPPTAQALGARQPVARVVPIPRFMGPRFPGSVARPAKQR